MAKYKIETFNDLIKILKMQLIKKRMFNNVPIDYDNFCDTIKSKNIVKILRLIKKLNIKLFIEE